MIFPSHLLITTSYILCLTNWEFTPPQKKSLTVITQKSEVMCFNSRPGSFLPPLFFDGTQLPYTDTFKFLGMACDRQINLEIAADTALRPFVAGTTTVVLSESSNSLRAMTLLTDGVLCVSVAWSLCNSTNFAWQCACTIPFKQVTQVTLPNATVPR
jgi:hypothetical protein